MAYKQNNPFSRKANSPLNDNGEIMPERYINLLSKGKLDERSGEPINWDNPADRRLYAHNRAKELGFGYGSQEYKDVQNEATRLGVRKKAMARGQSLRDWTVEKYGKYTGSRHSNEDWSAKSAEERARRKYFGDYGDPY